MKRCVLITGTGRSGTSMTAGLLRRAGMATSKDLVEGSSQNPLGSFEDRRIQQLQRKMLSKLGPLSMPPPQGWLKRPDVANIAQELSAVVAEELNNANGSLWGFKDPHSAFTMPLWTRIFNEEKITPTVFLCVREPSAVITSLIRQYDFDPAVAEVFWLTKNLRAILDTGADFFVVHYEALVSGDLALLSQIVAHARISKPREMDEIVSVIEPKLNRSGTNSYSINNPCVKRLWSALESSQGADFDRETLMHTAYEIEADIAAWSGFSHEIYRMHQVAQTKDAENLISSKQLADQVPRKALTAQLEEHTNTALKEQAQRHLKEQEALKNQLAEALSARNELEAKVSEATEANDTSKTLIATQLRELEEAREQTQNAAEEIFRLKTFAEALKREEGNIKAQARQERDALQRICDQQKDEIIALHGSTTQRVGRELRALRDAPLREAFRIPRNILRLLRTQRSKRREGLR